MIFSGVIATFVLKEKFMRIHAVGILLIACGVILIVYAKGNEKVFLFVEFVPFSRIHALGIL